MCRKGSELEILMIKQLLDISVGTGPMYKGMKANLLVTCNPNNGINKFNVEDFYTRISKTITTVHMYMYTRVWMKISKTDENQFVLPLISGQANPSDQISSTFPSRLTQS